MRTRAYSSWSASVSSLLVVVSLTRWLCGQEPPGATPPPPEDALDARVRKIETEVLEPALARVRERLASEEALDKKIEDLRSVWELLETEAAATADDLNLRLRLVARLERSLAEAVAALVRDDGGASATASAREAVQRSRRRHRERRVVDLYGTIKCWCPKEDWTRTLSGCFENCVNAQKGKIEEWLAKGHTNDEIRALMVEAAGTEEVLFKPRSRFSYFVPYAIFIAAIVFVSWTLSRIRRRAPAAAAPGEEEALDPEWEARLESELKDSVD